MAKEMMIVFVYDTARCCKEEDDPADAVMYFHPAWVSPTQRLALAGQLMGVNQFLSTSFSSPSMISLQGGKFVLKRFGSYVLAVGTDRNIQDWILERRSDILESLLKFFHCDFKMISESFNNDRNKFTEKLYQIFETYLPILQYSASLFSNLPMLHKFPRDSSNVFLEALQVLQYCQQTNGIIAGALFYNNKVIATQLSAEMTKQLVITDPYRIKAPAEKISTNFHLPVGVQLLRVFIEQRELSKLIQEVNTYRKHTSHSYKLEMKREMSTIKETVEQKKADYKRVYSTPLKDVNRVLLDFAISICAAGDENEVKPMDCNKQKIKSDNCIKEENMDDIPLIVKEALRCKRLNKLRNATPKEKLMLIAKDRNLLSLSLTDLEESLRKHSNKIVLKSYSLGLPKFNNSLCIDLCISEPRKQETRRRYYKTITDPCYPVFRNDGLPVSQFLYGEYIASHPQELHDRLQINDFTSEVSKNLHPLKNDISSSKRNNRGIENKPIHSKSNKPLDMKLENKNKQESYRRSMSLPLKPLNVLDNDDRRKSIAEYGSIFDTPQPRKLDGLQLTPLMSKLSILADERATPSEFQDLSNYSIVNNQVVKTKLEALNKEICNDNDDEIDKDCTTTTIDKEHLEKGELFLCGHQNMVLFLLLEDGTANNPHLIHSLWKTCINSLGQLETRLEQCLKPLSVAESEDLQCIKSGKMSFVRERPDSVSNESKELYSVLSVNSEWDTVHRSGLWGVTELDIVSSLHDRFRDNRNLTDIIVRTDDTVVYGNQCGHNEIFYQEAVAPNTGLPTPADLMGTVPLKAKSRLERDHAIIIL